MLIYLLLSDNAENIYSKAALKGHRHYNRPYITLSKLGGQKRCDRAGICSSKVRGGDKGVFHIFFSPALSPAQAKKRLAGL